MEFIKNSDYDYIMNKYHLLSEPFDVMNRFIRNDSVYDSQSGMNGDDIINELKRLDDEVLSKFPAPVRKAKGVEFVLKNTRISCDCRDIFPNINAIDRPLNKTIIAATKREAELLSPEELSKKGGRFEYTGICTIWRDFDHSVPYFDFAFELGFKGLLDNSEKARTNITDISNEQTAFFDGIKITYEAILIFLDRLIKRCDIDGNPRLKAALINLRRNPPATFYEVLLFDYLYFIISEHIEGLQVRSLCNFDRLLYKYYKNDLENGVSQEQIKSDLAYFLLQFTSINNYWNQPVFLGGCKEDESTEINDLSYLFLEVYDKMGILNPKVQIKIAESTPKKFILKVLDMIRRGHNCFVFVNDATIREAMMKTGISKEDARLANVKGCYEYSAQCTMSIGMNYFSLIKPIEFALHEGNDGVKGSFGVRKCKKAEDYIDFNDFYAEYKNQLSCAIENVIEIVNDFNEHLYEINPMNMLAATYPVSLEKGIDPLASGSKSNGSCLMFGYLADAVDSLANIKKYVFDKKLLTLGELRNILDKDFEGNEKLRLTLYNDPDKWGNNKDLPDNIATDIVDFVCKKVCGAPTGPVRNGKWNLGFHVARQSYDVAPRTASSANGRIRGQELSKNISASMGQNREGATAAILSATKIDATRFTSDACLDLGLLPSAVKGDDGLEAMYALLMTFMKRGGHAIHINVFDADTLRAAQKEPEKYKDLQIRVCGWNVLFNNISKVEQDGFIRQAEGLV